ncbi:ABC transporter permease [Streptomyces incarnatus]|uniref:ABC transporter permease n=1 Tax=Streptomyces sp. WP-1 TaxID=3041497 RepID=UPI002647C20B|nr:ABC transporter permease [Streptomyces sp. WP-1]WKE68290.1 ABC transporter permease [Streptomyces sp. WP-1]
MSARVPAWRIVRCSAVNAAADLRATYTWSTWLLGWLVRMLCQVLFFTLAGRTFSGGTHERFLFLGNSLALCAIEAMMVVASSAWERRAGTLPLLVAAPADVAWIFVGRSLQWLPSGIGTSLVALLGLGPFFGVHWTPATAAVAALLVASTAVGIYCFGLLLAALVLGASSWRNVASNVAYLSMMAVCGVEVPVDFWPPPVRVVAWAMPLTHGLDALRALVDGGGAATVARAALLCLAVGAAWLVAALLLLRGMAARGRRDGSIAFAI